MGKLPEPEDVDIFVNGGDPDPESIREMIEHIKEYKKRPEYADEIQEARRILIALEANSPEYRRLGADARLDQDLAVATPGQEAGPDGVDPEVALRLEKALVSAREGIRERLL